MKKLLFVLSSMNVGGMEKAFLNYVNDLSSSQFDITLLLLEKKGGFLEMVPDNVRIVSFDAFPERIKNEIMAPPLRVCKEYFMKGKVVDVAGLFVTHLLYKITNNRSLYYRFVLRGEERLEGFDEYHAYSGPTDIVSSLVAYKCTGGKKIQWIHFEIDKFQMNLNTARSLYRKMDEIRAVSYEALSVLTSTLPETKKKAVARPNRVSADLCRRAADSAKGYEDGYKGIRIVTLARMSTQKGLDIIPSVAAAMSSKGLSFRWYLIGDGEERETIEAEIKNNQVEDTVVLLGVKTNPYPFLKESDIYVQTSLYEGFCLALAEARAFNLPVVSTPFAGAHEQLDGIENCFVVSRTVEALSDAIENVLFTVSGEKHEEIT